MNEEALQYGYNLFKNDGYNGTLEEYKALISSNKEALDYSYTLFKNDGYKDSIDDFESLLGLKKKEDTESTSLDGSLGSQDLESTSVLLDDIKEAKREATKNTFMAAMAGFNDMLVSIPAGIYDIGGFFATPLSAMIGQDAARSVDLKESLGVEKTLSDYYKEEQERYRGKAGEAKKTFLEDSESSIMSSISKGDFNEALYKTFYAGLESAPVSLAMMAGGAVSSLPTLSAVSTLAFFEPSLDELRELDPEGSNAKNVVGALTMAGAESVFSSINAKALSSVYKNIIKKEGLEAGTQVFKKTLVEQLTSAMEKFGVPVAALSEGLEEVATLATQNAVKGKPIFEGAGDAFIIGAAMGGVMSSPITAAKAVEKVNKAIDLRSQKNEANKIIADSKYNDLTEAFSEQNITELDESQLQIMSLSQSKNVFESEIKKKLADGDITKEEAVEARKRFDEAVSIRNEFTGLGLSVEQQVKASGLIRERKALESKIKNKDANLVKKDKNRIIQINEELASLIDETEATTDAAPAASVVTQPAQEKVSDVLNRPITLTELGGSKLDTPIEGEIYVEGQQVVVEDADGNITEIGNVDEISNSSLEEMGIKTSESNVKSLTDGNLQVGEDVLVPDRKGIKKNKRGDISRVVLRNQDGSVTRTLRGADAEEAAYQILLSEATSPEQAETINQLLEQDEEFRKATAATEATADQDINEVDELEREAESFLETIGQKPLFQKEQAEKDTSDIDKITEEMNELSDERADFDVPSDLTTKKKTNIRSLIDRFGERVKTIKDISLFNDIPFMFTISDQLTSGDWVNPATGNTLKFFGGVGFNMTNDTSAWANVTENISNQTIRSAKDIYKKHKSLFDRLWTEGKLPYGHIPMAVVKMGQESIESNEAIFRIVSDNLKSKFTESERTAAQVSFLDLLKAKQKNIEESINNTKDSKKLKVLKAQLAKNKKVQDYASNYSSIDGVLDNITQLPITSRKDIRDAILFGAVSDGAPTKPGTPNSPVINKLLEGKDDSMKSLFHLPTINDQVREEATKEIPEAHVISIVGIDVINSRVTSVANGDFQHQNYGYGVKGQLIGILESPVHAADVFPEMYSKSIYTFKENIKGKLPSPEGAVGQSVAAGGQIAIIKAFKGAKVSTKMTSLDIVLGKLRQAFPNVTVVNTQAEFDAMVNSKGVSKYSRDGDIIYGFTKGDKVFLNPKIANTNTAIHEFSHVWMNFVGETNPGLLQKGYDLLEGTDILKEKIKIHGDNKLARTEALADLIGNKGDSIVDAGKKSKFKNWLNAMYTYIKSKFKAFSEMSAEEFQNMTLDQFVDGVLVDLLSSREISDKAVKSIETTFQKVNANDLIEKGIENGFSKEAIKLGLERIGADTSNFNNEYSKAKDKYDSNIESPKSIEIDDLYERSNKAIKDKIKKKGVAYYRDTTRELLLDRQTRIKRLLKGIGSEKAQRALNQLITKSGGSGYANFRFKKAEEKIYEGLSKEDISTIDKIIYARRIDAINTNRKKRGMESYVGVEGYGQEAAKRNLNEIKDVIGEEKFRDLNSRATEYFNVFDKSLDRMREANLISEEVYTQLKETEYSPIKTIKYLIPESYDAAEVDRMAEMTGMNSSLIKSLSDENVNDVIMDSKWLLQTNLSMVEARVFENRMLNSFYDAVQEATEEEAKAIEEFVLPNPEVGKTKEGKPIYKYDKYKVPVGFVKVSFLSEGNKVDMVIQEAYARQLLDVKKNQGFLDKAIPKITATNVLRFFATSGNPLFIIGNTAVDFANILFLSDVYSKNKFTGGAKLAFDSVSVFLSKVAGSAEYNKIYEDYMEHGGSMDYLSSDGLKALESIKSKGAFLDSSKKAAIGWGRAMAYLGESSEIAFRLSVFQKSKENQIKEFKKTNKRDPDADEMQDIMFEAAREARETIDFAQGGSLVKSADKALPYLNAATQGFRKASDYAIENPAGFASSMTQYMIMSGGFAAMSMFFLLRALGDEEKDEVINILNSVSDYEKANYHIVFTGKKDADGEWKYVRFKKLPTTSVFATIAENMVLKAALESRGIKYDFNEELLLKNLESAVPIVPTPKNLLSRNPVFAAAVTYQFNYDMFYDQEVFKAPRDKKIEASAEGVYDNRVNQIYKDLAKFSGMSPKRTQAALEKIITSESTNPMIGLIYSGYDMLKAPFTKGVGLNDEIENVIERTLESTSKKLVRKTNKDLIRYKQEADVDAERINYDTEKYLSEQKMYSEIKKRYKEEKGEMTVGEFTDLIKENFDPKDQKKYTKKYLAYIKNINSDPAILDIIYEDTPEIQAMMLFNKYGDALEQEEIESILQVYKASGRKISKDGLNIYRQKYQKK